MNTIIIDSGSTKADVAVISSTEDTIYYTQEGINPQIQKEIKISDRLQEDLKHAEKIIFYGAGTDTNRDTEVLTSFFKQYNVAVAVEAYSDMLGACRATAGHNSGIVSILGTGSNSCVYDGAQIVDNLDQYGYLLHDHGGGSYIGKKILQDYFDGIMPENLAIHFSKQYDLSRDYVLHQLYKSNNTSRYLASHVKFLSLVKGKWKKQILNEAFDSFIQKRILRYTDYEHYDLHFVGSIAYSFNKRLSKALDKYNLNIKSIEQKPIKKLVKFHKS